MDNYLKATPKSGLEKTQKITDNINVKSVMKEIDCILRNEMHKTVVVFRTANTNFVTKYSEVRIIVDPGNGVKVKNQKQTHLNSSDNS